jgi:site-specific recombinase XerD
MVDGKQMSYYARRQRDVIEAMRVAREAVVNNEPPPTPSQKRTIGQVAEEWLATKKLRNNTLSAYKAYLKNHILPEFANVHLGNLTPGRMERFLSSSKQKGSDEPLSAKSAQQIRAILQSMLSFAIKEGYVRRNVAQLADAPEVIPTKISPFTPQQSPHC